MIARPPLAVPLAALAGFVALVTLVAGGWPPLERFDDTISSYFREYGASRPDLVSVLRIATDVAATGSYLLAGLAVTVALAARGRRRVATCCAVVTVAIPLLWGLGHWLLHRPRPVDGFVLIDSNGFPSGHTSHAAAAALLAVLLLWPHQRPAGRAVTAFLAGGFVLVVGLTRLALLAHWPADVLGGWLLALVVVPLAARIVPVGPVAPVAPAGPAERGARVGRAG